MSKDKKCKCKASKNIVFHCQICKFVGFLLPSSSWLLKLANNLQEPEFQKLGSLTLGARSLRQIPIKKWTFSAPCKKERFELYWRGLFKAKRGYKSFTVLLVTHLLGESKLITEGKQFLQLVAIFKREKFKIISDLTLNKENIMPFIDDFI